MLKYITSFLLLSSIAMLGQVSMEAQDSIPSPKHQKYGIRVGIDLSKPFHSIFDNQDKGIEITADYRIKPNLFIAAEMGATDRTSQEDYFNFTTKGAYIKAGINFNAYKNWLDMQNEIFVGLRYGFSSFSHTINSITPNQHGSYFSGEAITSPIDFDNLSAHWAEFIFGIKAEAFNNLFIGFSVSLKGVISQTSPENFKNIYIPGVNAVNLNNNGVGFNYTLSYLIPFTKKNK
ncbi:MAG: hypothetical protein COB98_00480 [Flavobacteriaceae bacterium]|nr:MAG: hypothetical protein COB98_00480 [Flavobacteriaceae bacterium]